MMRKLIPQKKKYGYKMIEPKLFDNLKKNLRDFEKKNE